MIDTSNQIDRPVVTELPDLLPRLEELPPVIVALPLLDGLEEQIDLDLTAANLVASVAMLSR